MIRLLLMLCVVLHCAPTVAWGYDQAPQNFRAADMLPAEMLKGPQFSVDPTVRNDGYMNVYTLHSAYGDFTVVSTNLLKQRIRELAAIEAIDKIDLSKEFGDSVVEGGQKMIEGAKKIVTRPDEVVTGVFSGIATAFQRAEENLVESNRSQTEDGAAKNLIGFSKAKREYAVELGVDPYSTNQALQERLEKLSWAGYTGGLTFGLATAVVPGAAGIAVTSVRYGELIQEIDLTKAPADLRRENREKLLAMGVGESAARVFINNTFFSPSGQSFLVAALDKCRGVADRQAFVEFAATTDSMDLAYFRQRMAAMYYTYHAEHGLAGFFAVDRFIAARTRAGEMLVCFPLDYGMWTSATATVMRYFDSIAADKNLKRKILMVEGRLSPAARKELSAMGWTVREGS